ncbi:BTAD domain-containing putative transcriptional regulator [Kitasatospora sp. NPDC049285]|uniref:AfsR/SARP family transcriptional regulator n=1 Tax=Kitasatospora sp. NPDC049285 TaxID=3157096 RepID=UPI00341B6A27
MLGPLDAEFAGRRIALGGARQRTVLAMLLLARDRVVSVESLVEAVWPSGAPATARNQVAICVAKLRKVFKSAAGTDDLIRTEHPGYLLALGEHRLDAAELDGWVQAARHAARGGRLSEAQTLVEEALGLWRGRVLEGMTAPRLTAAAARLDERRLELVEERAELQLQLGRHRMLVGELAALVKEHPLREQTRAQLMLAQYRSGQRAEALEVFRQGRQLLVEELGLEPGSALQAMHDLILHDEPEPARRQLPPGVQSTGQVPAQLLADVADFTGRTSELGWLDRALEEDGGPRRPLRVAAITGMAGIGKTALALHWANRAAHRFPDGQLYADLRGWDGSGPPASPGDLLGGFLRALGVPELRIPPDPDSRAALFRSVLSGKRVLIVLDNARSFAQVRLLLPGRGRCCVLLTGRDVLDDLTGDFAVQRLSLATLDEADAAALLGRIAGPGRLAADPEATERLGALCDRLPLALRIAAARLVAKPHWSVRSLVDRLENRHRRLDELSPGGGGVRAGFTPSYLALTPAAARLFRRLGLLPGSEFSPWAAARLLDSDLWQAETLLEQLVDARLLEAAPGPPDGDTRYRLPELLRLFARERAAAEESGAERAGALRRVHGGRLALAGAARRELPGGPSPGRDAGSPPAIPA